MAIAEPKVQRNARLPESVATELDAHCEATGVGTSAAIEAAVRHYLDVPDPAAVSAEQIAELSERVSALDSRLAGLEGRFEAAMRGETA